MINYNTILGVVLTTFASIARSQRSSSTIVSSASVPLASGGSPLPISHKATSPFNPFEISDESCDHFSSILVLRCVSPLIEYTKQYSYSGPTADPNLICSLYDDYKNCAPESIRRACSRFVASVESVYDYVCSREIKTNFTKTYRCLATQERHPSVIACERNVTSELRVIALNSGNASDEARTDSSCDAIRGYFKCVKDHFLKFCSKEGWFVKKEVTIRSTTVGVANCTDLEELDPKEPICDAQGDCRCRNGYVFRKDKKKCEDFDECASNFGLCSQRCVNTEGAYKCVCDERYYTLEADKRTCNRNDLVGKSPPEPVSILFAHGQSIWNISEDGENFQLLRAGLQKAAMIALDVEERRLYYVDIGANKIQRIRYEGAFPQTLQELDVEGTEGIALDWIGRKLYSMRHTDMFVQELDGSFKKTLYTGVFKLPRALALHPLAGYAYGSDWGQQSFIARAAMDGSQFTKIVSTGLVWPNGLAVDYYADRVYWADAFLDVIECSNLDGTGRQVVLQDASKVPHVFSMIVFDDLLYWTDWTYRGIVRANKYTGENVTVVAQAALLPYGIGLHHQNTQPKGENPCDKLKCTQMCLLSPLEPEESAEEDGKTNNDQDMFQKTRLKGFCTCADDFKLNKDGITCDSVCDTEKHLQCGEADPICLSLRYKCDGVSQCREDEDETDCPQRICLPGQFQCHNGDGCLSENQVCDSRPQCNDSSDEAYC